MPNWEWNDAVKEAIRTDAVRIRRTRYTWAAGAGPQQIAGIDAMRIGFVIWNISADSLIVGLDENEVSNERGITVPGYGIMEVSLFEDGPIATDEWWVMNDSFGGDILVIEYRRVAVGETEGRR